MKKMACFVFFSSLLAVSMSVAADVTESDLADLKGYTILGSGTITGWADSGKKGKKGDSFEGCDYDRKIILDDKLTITCTEYNYSYSYRPTAIILSNGSDYKMIVEGQIYSMKK